MPVSKAISPARGRLSDTGSPDFAFCVFPGKVKGGFMVRKLNGGRYGSVDEIDEAIRQLKEEKRLRIAQDKQLEKEFLSKVDLFLGAKLRDLLPDWKELDLEQLESYLQGCRDDFSLMTTSQRSVSDAIAAFEKASSRTKKPRSRKKAEVDAPITSVSTGFADSDVVKPLVKAVDTVSSEGDSSSATAFVSPVSASETKEVSR